MKNKYLIKTSFFLDSNETMNKLIELISNSIRQTFNYQYKEL